MKKIFFKLLPLIIALLTGVSLNATIILNIQNQTVKDDQILRDELEKAYNKVRKALEAKCTIEEFYSVFEFNEDPNLPPITKEEWPLVLNDLTGAFPELNKFHFVFAEQEEEYAYYYGWEEASNLKKINVKNFVFHKTAQGWKLTGYSRIRNTNKATTVEENNAIAKDLISVLKAEAKTAQKQN